MAASHALLCRLKKKSNIYLTISLFKSTKELEESSQKIRRLIFHLTLKSSFPENCILYLLFFII